MRASRYEFATLVLLSPLFLFPPTGRPVLTLILLLPIPWLLALGKGSEALPRTALNGSLALLVLMVAVSLYATFDIFFSASKVLGVVFGVAVFFAVVRQFRTRGHPSLAIDLFVLAGSALAAVGLLGTNWMNKLPAVASITARMPAVIRGVPGQAEGFQPNAIAGALVMFLPLQLALAISAFRSEAPPWRRLTYAMLFLFTGGTLLLTQSRGGYVSISVAFAAWAIWSGRRSRAIALTLILIAGIVAIPLRHRVVSALSHSVGSGVASDVESRTELWSRAVMMIEDFPFTGAGMNTFRRIMPVMYPAFLTPTNIDIAHAHNHLLQAALDLGVPGLIAYLALWFGAAALLVRAYRKAAGASQRLIIGGLAAGMVAYFVFGTADAIALGAKVGIFFWIALALIVSIADREQTA
jgi:putative inorganic carbon (HCO3(-)) transporter